MPNHTLQIARPNTGGWHNVWMDGEHIYEGHSYSGNRYTDLIYAVMQHIEGEITIVEIDYRIWDSLGIDGTNLSWEELMSRLTKVDHKLYSLETTNYGNDN